MRLAKPKPGDQRGDADSSQAREDSGFWLEGSGGSDKNWSES